MLEYPVEGAEIEAAQSEGKLGDKSDRKLDRSAWSRAWYQGVRDPYIGLVMGFLFAPYFATVVLKDPVKGQAVMADIGRYSGLIVAVVAPILGAAVDQIGARKPWLFLCTAMLIPLMAVLWFCAPDGTGLTPSLTALVLIVISVLISAGEVLFSSMLPTAAKPAARSDASGMALTLGNITSIAMMLFMLFAFVLPERPWLGLSKAAHEPDRVIGPVVAICFAAGAWPLFVWTRDTPKAATASLATIWAGLKGLWNLVRNAAQYRDAMIYLVARTISQDAGIVLLTLSGVLAAGVMGWGAEEMLVYGLFGCVAGMAGGMIASRMDRAFGPRPALQIQIGGSIIGLIGMLGCAKHMILWSPASDAPVWAAPMFRSAPELVFLAFTFVGTVFQIAAWSSARTLLTRLAPADKVGSFFGLAALAAACTGWLGPSLVGMFTRLFGRQQAGFYPIAVLLLVGMLALFLVKGGGREA